MAKQKDFYARPAAKASHRWARRSGTREGGRKFPPSVLVRAAGPWEPGPRQAPSPQGAQPPSDHQGSSPRAPSSPGSPRGGPQGKGEGLGPLHFTRDASTCACASACTFSNVSAVMARESVLRVIDGRRFLLSRAWDSPWGPLPRARSPEGWPSWGRGPPGGPRPRAEPAAHITLHLTPHHLPVGSGWVESVVHRGGGGIL